MTDLVRLVLWLRPAIGWTVLAVILGVATVATNTGLLGVATYLISAAALHPPLAELTGALYLVRFFALSRAFARYGERLVSHDVSFRVLGRLRLWLYGRLARLAPGQLLALRSADLLARLVRDVDEGQTVFQRLVGPLLVAAVTSVVVVGGLWAIDTRLGAAGGVALLALGLGLPALSVFFTRGPHADQVRQRAELDVRIADGLHGLPDLLVFGQAGQHVQRTLDVADGLGQTQKRLATLAGLRLAGQDAMARLGAWSVLLLAIPLVATDELGVVFLAVLAIVLLGAAEALEPLAQSAQALGGTRAAARRMWEIADLRPALISPPDSLSLRPLPDGQEARPRLEFCGVGFTYDGPLVLSDVSFVLRPGHAIGVVGRSGGGKSTLLSLAARAWDPTAGQVQLNGRDVRTESAELVTRTVGLLTQDSYIFSGTLRDNLQLGRSFATEHELEQALQGVGLDETLRQLPEGLDSWLGDQGARLSGGERRRLALARMLLRDVSFLLLDEPTANLDPMTERAIMGVVRAASRTRGILLVTHRLVDLDWLDELLVLDEGCIVERGRHADLRRAGGLYERMVDVQEALLAGA